MRRFSTAIPALVAFGATAASLSAQQGDALSILERAGDAYAALSALCADFDQVIEVRLLGETRESQGRMCQQPPDLFFMEFTEPAGDRVVADGEFLWVYYPSTDDKQVFKATLAGGGGGLDFHREFLSEPGVKYDATYRMRSEVDGLTLHEIDIVPTRPASYTRATVWIDEGQAMIRKVVLEEENGSLRTVGLSDLELDPTVDPARFRFTPPPGAHVLER